MSIKRVPPVSSDTILSRLNGGLFDTGDLQIWSISLDADEKFRNACKNALDEKGRKRIDYFKFKQVQESYIISQGGLRLLLSHYLGIPPKEIQIGKLSKGKPYSIDNPNLCFNMSNSGRKVVYAFSMDEDVGIDLEKIRELPDLDELIEKNYIPSERDYINKLPEQRQYRFFQFWTIKEAYLKAIGVGMRIPPDNIAFSIQNGEYKLQSIHGVPLGFEQSDWIFNPFTLENNKYVGTLVSKNQNVNITLRSLV